MQRFSQPPHGPGLRFPNGSGSGGDARPPSVGPRTGHPAQAFYHIPNEPSPAKRQTGVAAKKRFLMCSLQPWTCLRVEVLPRQWVVGPSSNSRLRRGETLAGASSAANARACGRPQAAGGDWSAALANVQAATSRTDRRPESASFSETSEKGVLEQPNRDKNGEGSASRTGPSWTKFVRPAHQALVAFAGAGIINRAEPFATMLERAETQEGIGLNRSRLRPTRPVSRRISEVQSRSVPANCSRLPLGQTPS